MAFLAVSLMLGVMELGLRISGFHFIPPGNGKAENIFEKQGDFLVTRPVYAQVVQPQKIRLESPDKDFRIGAIGGSSIHNLGTLEPMRVILHARSSRFLPVLNFGAVSYGTVRELLHFPELLSYRPNVVIIYSGHNEFEENLLNDLRLRSAPFHAIDLWLGSSLRLYQAVSWGAHEAGGKLLKQELLAPIVNPQNRMSWNIAHDKAHVLELYQRNLETMLALARNAGVPVILSTVAYNRRMGPFRELPGNPFHEGEKLFAEGKFAEAKALLERGLDEDQNPHRASETTNHIVREVAARYGVHLLDADAEIVKQAPHQIPGPELFADHCHLNHSWGNRILQRLFAAKILELGLLR
jgi:hypothetical protein